MPKQRDFNSSYKNEHLSRVAFPLGGIGTGMMCIEGAGALSHVSLRHRMQFFNEPLMFSALHVAGAARVTEGPVPLWKHFGRAESGLGQVGSNLGLPRFESAEFTARFPFAEIKLTDSALPLDVGIKAWNPFIPGDADASSLPVTALEYTFHNTGGAEIDAVYSFHSKNHIATSEERSGVRAVDGGFVMYQEAAPDAPHEEGALAAVVYEPGVRTDCAWFRGGFWDALSVLWKNIETGAAPENPPHEGGRPNPGASLYLPLKLAVGEKRTVRLLLAWYVPVSDIRMGRGAGEPKDDDTGKSAEPAPTYTPHYAARFETVNAVMDYWRRECDALRDGTEKFTECFYDTTLPPEAVEAAAANLTILKSTTVLRDAEGRFWGWEGNRDDTGSCHGTCTHVWNYAQALPHLFPSLERTLRETSMTCGLAGDGHETFRIPIPIRDAEHSFYAAADGQLGGIMKLHREWRVSGDTEWMKTLLPAAVRSIDYCIETWDPDRAGALVEPHHNTYDIEFWGADGMCTSIYLGALRAMVRMGEAADVDVSAYAELADKAKEKLEGELFNGEYFFQKVEWKGLRAGDPTENEALETNYSPEAVDLMKKEGPKYQYGTGCLSDGVLGAWFAEVCGVGGILDSEKVKSHLLSVYKNNLRKNLRLHANPQRPAYALGDEGGLLLCSWPNGGMPTLPFVYSNEVWTGIEYQAASHLVMHGCVKEGLEIVRTARSRYDGRVRNPFNEYECGHWYTRAMSSYALLGALSGARYDAVEKTLYLSPKVGGDFRAFISTAAGYGTIGVAGGEPFIETAHGEIEVNEIKYTPAPGKKETKNE